MKPEFDPSKVDLSGAVRIIRFRRSISLPKLDQEYNTWQHIPPVEYFTTTGGITAMRWLDLGGDVTIV
jgi:hypothetical protein